MPDITDVLTSAARDDIAPLDLGRVERRAATLRRRQQATRSVAAFGVVVIAVVLFRGAGGGPEALELIPADPSLHPTARPSATGTPAPNAIETRTANPTAAPVARSSSADRSGSQEASGASPASPQRSATSPEPGAGAMEGDFPPRASCSASTTTLGPDQAATCTFTATAEGGWSLTATAVSRGGENQKAAAADIWVHRDGVTTHYDIVATSAYCGDDIVRPGDLVTVTIRQMRAGRYADSTLGAGAGYSCS